MFLTCHVCATRIKHTSLIIYMVAVAVNNELAWALGAPMLFWYVLSLTVAGVRFKERHFDCSLGALRGAVARAEVADASPDALSDKSWGAISTRIVHRWAIGMGYLFGVLPLAPAMLRTTGAVRQRTARLVGEMYLQVQPMLVLLIWGVTMIAAVKGGVLFGVLLLSVGEAATVGRGQEICLWIW